jgi:DNA-binding transcriptional MerR regulator
MLSELTFESRNVVGLVGITERELRHWADRGIVVPDIADAVGRPGVRRRYSFENLIQVAIVKELLRQGINLHEAARILTVYKNSLAKHSPGLLYLVIQNGAARVLDMKKPPTKAALGARLEKLLDPKMALDSFSIVAIHQLKERLITRVKETVGR